RRWNTLAFRGRLMSLLVLTHCGVSSRPLLHRSLAYHARILKTFSYLYQVGFVTLLRLLLSVQAFAFRGRLMSLLELTLCGVSLRPFIPQESHACTPSNKCKCFKQLTSVTSFRSTYYE